MMRLGRVFADTAEKANTGRNTKKANVIENGRLTAPSLEEPSKK
jgi:hypothetical protein